MYMYTHIHTHRHIDRYTTSIPHLNQDRLAVSGSAWDPSQGWAAREPFSTRGLQIRDLMQCEQSSVPCCVAAGEDAAFGACCPVSGLACTASRCLF